MKFSLVVSLLLVSAVACSDASSNGPSAADGGASSSSGTPGGQGTSGGPGGSLDAGSANDAGATPPPPATLAWTRELTAKPHPGVDPQVGDIIGPRFAVSSDGNLYVSSLIHGDVTIDGKTFEGPNATGQRGLLTKFDMSGALLWGLPLSDVSNAQVIVPTPDGGVIVASDPWNFSSVEFFTPTPPDSTKFDKIVCLARLDAQGNKKWSGCGAGLPSFTKCDLRVGGGIAIDNGVIVFAGQAFGGACQLPTIAGEVAGGEALDDVGTSVQVYIARYDLETGAFLGKNLLTRPQNTTYDGYAVTQPKPGSVRVEIRYRTKALSLVHEIYDGKTGAKLETLDVADSGAQFPFLRSDGAGGLFAAFANNSSPLSIGGTSIPASTQYIAWFDENGKFVKLRQFPDERVGAPGSSAFGNRIALTHGAGYTTNFGGPPFDPKEQRTTLVVSFLDAAGNYERRERVTIPESYFLPSGNPLDIVLPLTPGNDEDLLFAGILGSGPIEVIGKTIAGPKAVDPNASRSIWFGKAHVPHAK